MPCVIVVLGEVGLGSTNPWKIIGRSWKILKILGQIHATGRVNLESCLIFGSSSRWELAGWLSGWLSGCLAVWLSGWLSGCLAVWLAGCLAVWLSGCLAVCLCPQNWEGFVNRSWVLTRMINRDATNTS